MYLFYSQMAVFNPAFVGEDVRSFLLVNQYTLVLLIALDRLIGQFSKDRAKTEVATTRLKKHLAESQE